MVVDVITPQDNLWHATLAELPHDIYHLPGYVAIEALRTGAIPEAIVIRDDDCKVFLPYLLRHLDQNLDLGSARCFDVTSPYGYPGPLLSAEALHDAAFIRRAHRKLITTLHERGVCSAFFRLHPILNQDEGLSHLLGSLTKHGDIVVIDLRLPQAERWRQIRKGHRETVKKLERGGFTAQAVSFEAHLDDFWAIYLDTMQRVNAISDYYSFDIGYFRSLQAALGDKLHLVTVNFNSDMVAAGLYFESCGIVQSALGGTSSGFTKASPGTLETHFATSWFAERGNNLLNLGGGLGASPDSLYHYKSGFSKLTYPFHTSQLVLDVALYQTLVARHAQNLGVTPEQLIDTGFFPAYRVPPNSVMV